ncbi:MAG: preprotein translocase subunit SecY, partial [Aigarchaeota archaeon]|nr:preprotein translocase subunit SecY [Aigarchaeota archaeon]
EPFGAGTGFQGLLLAIGQTIASGKGIESLVYRGQFPDLVGLASTTLVMIAIIYLESTKIEIPISYAKYSGYRAKYPIKLLYVSNVPVIFASTIFANIYYISSLLWNNYNRSNTNFFLNLIGRFNATEGGQPQPLSGLAYYTTSPRTLTGVAEDPVRALMYLAFMVVLSLAFSILWVEIGGLGSSRVAQQLVDAGMQVPGFRRSEGIIARVVDRYINVVTVLGGIFIGLIAGLADFFNVFGSGIGILLMVGILYQYYELLVRERVTEMYPALGRILGR